MRNLTTDLHRKGYKASTWEEYVSGKTIFSKICEQIYSHDFVIAEVTERNLNVLFEVGYSLAIGRDVILLTNRNRLLKPLRLLQTKEQCFYSTRKDILLWIAKYWNVLEHKDTHKRMLPKLEYFGIKSAENVANSIYYVRPDQISDAVLAVENEIRESCARFLIPPPLESVLDPFYAHCYQILRSELVTGMMVSNEYLKYEEINASVALLMGVAVGLGKHVLALQELPNKPMLDLGTILNCFEGEHSARDIVRHWLGEFPEPKKFQPPPTFKENPPAAPVATNKRQLFVSSPARILVFVLGPLSDTLAAKLPLSVELKYGSNLPESPDNMKDIVKGANTVISVFRSGCHNEYTAAELIGKGAQNAGILAIGIAVEPFSFEGREKLIESNKTFQRLTSVYDSILRLSLDKFATNETGQLDIISAGSKAARIIVELILTVHNIVSIPNLTNTDISDLRYMFEHTGEICVGIGLGGGESRVADACKAAISLLSLAPSPKYPRKVFFEITGGPSLTLTEANDGAEIIAGFCDPESDIVFSITFDYEMSDNVRVLLITDCPEQII